MEITINQHTHVLAEELTISALIIQFNFPQKGIAVAIKNQVIPKIQWEGLTIKEGDEITIITATQGG